MIRLLTILTLLISTYNNAQNTIIEYQVKKGYSGGSGREFLIYNDDESYYFDYVDGGDVTINEILKNYDILRGGQKAYRKMDEFNKLWRIKTYPNSGKQHFLIIDNKPVIDWKIEKGEKKILNFICQKATGEFRGRTYTVWFTKEIPTALGPWKLDGLPGMILEAQDNDRVNIFEAVQIVKNTNSKIPDSVYSFMKDYDKTQIRTYQDFIEKENIQLKERQQKGIANLPKGTVIIEIPPIRDLQREKTFEWENNKQP